MPEFAVLHLCSWYPTPFRPEHGIFHKSHIRSVSLYSKHIVIYVAFNENLKEKKEYCHTENNFYEYLVILPKKKGFYNKIKKFFIWFNSYAKLIRHVLKKHPDIHLIHLHVAFPVGMVILLTRKLRSFPFIISEQWSGYFKEDGNYKGILRVWVTKKLFKKCQKVLVGSDKLGNRLIELGLTKSYIFMENVLPAYFFQNHVFQDKKNNKIHFLHVSSLTDREKNITGMLNAFLKLKQINAYSFLLTIVGGNNEDVNLYRKWVKRHGLENNIQFMGRVMNHELPEYYNQADAFVLFSHFESQPVVVLEAWAMGVPALCTPVGQLSKWMKPALGACARLGNEEELLELLLRAPEIIKHSDANEMKQFLKENFSEEVVGKKLNKIYEELLEEVSS